MQVLLIGNCGPGSPSWSTENDVGATLRSMGHEVSELGENSTFSNVGYQNVKPRADAADLVLWISTPGHVKEGMAKAIGETETPTMGLHLDLYRGLARERNAIESPFFKVDMMFTADGGAPEGWWEARGVNHRWSPPGILESSCYLAKPDPVLHPAEVVFVGCNEVYHHEWAWRPRLVKVLQAHYGDRFAIYNHGWQKPGFPGSTIESKMRGDNANVLYATAKVAVGDSCFAGRQGFERFTTDRLFEAGGRGALQIFPRIRGVTAGEDALMVDGQHIITFDAEDETSMLDAVEMALALSDGQRQEIRQRGMAHVKSFHTYKHRLLSAFEQMRADGIEVPE